jgi:hypothetical protein
MQATTNAASATADPGVGRDDGLFRLETMQLDLPALVGAFSQRLHDGGVSVTPAQSGQYVPTRAIFVRDVHHVAPFDRVFVEVFGSRGRTARS